jgi:hypothetical protein
MTNTATSQRSSRSRYGFQYCTIILALNLIAAFKGEELDKILFVDGLIVAVFGIGAIVTRFSPNRFRRDSN